MSLCYDCVCRAADHQWRKRKEHEKQVASEIERVRERWRRMNNESR